MSAGESAPTSPIVTAPSTSSNAPPTDTPSASAVTSAETKPKEKAELEETVEEEVVAGHVYSTVNKGMKNSLLFILANFS